MKDPNRFEDLVVLCLQDLDRTLRPTGGSGDRQRDAVTGGLFLDAETVLTISLDGKWSSKARRDLAGLMANAAAPRRVIVVSNRRTSPKTRNKLSDEAPMQYGVEIQVLDQRFLALRLLRQDLLHVREELLGLPLPAHPVALEAAAYGEKLVSTASRVDALYGRTSEIAVLLGALESSGTVALEGAGGVGKTRLALEAGQRIDARTLFIDDRSQLVRDELPVELAGADHLVLVVDNAHRRGDLREIVGLLARRTGPTNLVLIARPGFREHLIDAVDGSILGPLAAAGVIELGPLPPAVIGDIVRNAQPELVYAGAIDRAIGIAQGNPLFALLAHKVAVEGGGLDKLGQAEVLAKHAQSLIKSLLDSADGATEHEVVELLAIIAGLTYLDLGEPVLQSTAARLLDVTEVRLRRLLHDFADAGIVTQSDQRFAITPDILSGHILWSSFFADDPSVALRFEALWGSVVPSHIDRLCAGLGGLPPESVAPDHRLGRFIAQQLLDRARTGEQVLELVRAIAPAIPWLAANIIDSALQHLPVDPKSRTRALVAAAEALERSPSFVEGWPRQMSVAAAAFTEPLADTGDSDQAARDRITDGLTKVYTRIPIDRGPGEGKVLASVQREMATATKKFWRRHRHEPGTAQAVAIAARQLLTVTFSTSYTTAENEMTVQLHGYALPATPFTRETLFAGTELFAETIPLVCLRLQMKQAQKLDNLTRAGRELDGPFGARPSTEMAAMAREAQADLVSRLARLNGLPIVPRAALEDQLGTIWPEDEELREFHDLLSVAGGRRRRDAFDEPAASDRVEDMARRIVEAYEPAAVLNRWARWLHEAQASGDRHWSTHIMASAIRMAAISDPTTMSDVLDEQLRNPSPLTQHLVGALAMTLTQTDEAEQRARRHIHSSHEEVRAAAARAVGASDLHARVAILGELVNDSSWAVRSAVQSGLTHHAGFTQTELDLALQACLPNDTAGLTHIMWRLRHEDSALTAGFGVDQAAIAHRIVLNVAADDRLDGHELQAIFELIDDLAPRLPIEFVKARIEHQVVIERPQDLRTYMRIDALPEEIRNTVSAAATGDDLSWVLDQVESIDSSSPAHGTIRDLLEWLDDGPVVTQRIAGWFTSESEHLRYEAHRVLDHRLSARSYRERARALLAAGVPAEVEDEIIDARQPRFWSGTRHRYWRALRDEFATWMDDPDALVADLGKAGAARYQALLDSEPGSDPGDAISDLDEEDA
jgi:hypothetical protein